MNDWYQQLLNQAVNVGYALLANGAEIYRVEESIQRILLAYGVKGAEVFVIPTCITTTVFNENNEAITQIRRLYQKTTNFDTVEQVNDLCRRICQDKPELAWIGTELQRIAQRPVYPLKWLIFGYAVASFGFTLFFGGSLSDAFCALVLGIIIRLVATAMESLATNAFFINVVNSGIIALVALGAVHFSLAQNADKIIIGVLMLLVPGVAITNSIRDVIAGDLVAGLMRMTEALMVATAIAVGAGGALTISQYLWGG